MVAVRPPLSRTTGSGPPVPSPVVAQRATSGPWNDWKPGIVKQNGRGSFTVPSDGTAAERHLELVAVAAVDGAREDEWEIDVAHHRAADDEHRLASLELQ